MNNINSRLDSELFPVWESQYSADEAFARDGVIDETLFESATKKVLFIGKEPNNPTQDLWDYREWWKAELKYSFSTRIAEWAYGILNNFPDYDTIWKDGFYNAHQALMSIAFMNLKKSGGTGNSSLEEMCTYAERDRDLIIKEINLINPDIIILGLSWEKLINSVFNRDEMGWTNTGHGVWKGNYNGADVIVFYHPSARNAPPAAYYLLEKVIKSLKRIP